MELIGASGVVIVTSLEKIDIENMLMYSNYKPLFILMIELKSISISSTSIVLTCDFWDNEEYLVTKLIYDKDHVDDKRFIVGIRGGKKWTVRLSDISIIHLDKSGELRQVKIELSIAGDYNASV